LQIPHFRNGALQPIIYFALRCIEIAQEVKFTYREIAQKLYFAYFKNFIATGNNVCLSRTSCIDVFPFVVEKLKYEVANKNDLVGVEESKIMGFFTGKKAIKSKASVFSLGIRQKLVDDLETFKVYWCLIWDSVDVRLRVQMLYTLIRC
jgi:hypothetical protein